MNRKPSGGGARMGLFVFAYLVGLYAVRTAKNFWRLIRRKTVLLRRRFLERFRRLSVPFRRFAAESVRLWDGFAKAFRELRDAAKTNHADFWMLMICLPMRAVKRHRRFLSATLNWIAPLVTVTVLISTIGYWSMVGYALEVEYDGVSVGYVSDENVLDRAVEMANGRIINVDNSSKIERTPKLKVAMVSDNLVMNVNETCDALLKSAGCEVIRASGLYIDGHFEAALASGGTMVQLLNTIKAAYETDSDDEEVTFLQEVEIIDGLYPASAVISAEDMKSKLTATHEENAVYTAVRGDTFQSVAKKYGMTVKLLKEMNPKVRSIRAGTELKIIKQAPYLQVAILRTVKYTESVEYKTVTKEDENYYLGYEKVVIAGRNGKRSVVAEVKLMDGTEIERTVLSSKELSKPVDRVVIAGSKVYQKGTVKGDGISTGTFIWPLPATKTISSGYGYRDGEFHAGIDISNGNTYGLPIIAADGGTVIDINTSGYGTSYGQYVLIDHGNGYQTMYAHCSSVLVTAGQKVAQGEMIARVGNTGRSYGAHLHFEVRVNGSIVNPLPFLGMK